jgi:hypothetical protein
LIPSLFLPMIKVNVEIRLENSISQYAEIEPISKESLLREKSSDVQQIVSTQFPSLAEDIFMTSQTSSWKRLPKLLYRATKPGEDGCVIIKKTKKISAVSCSEYATFNLHLEDSVHSPNLIVTISNNDLIC